MKKILGAVLATVFIVVPLGVMAVDPCAYGPSYDAVACANSGAASNAPVDAGVTTNAPAQTGVTTNAPAASQGTSANVRLQNPIKYGTFSEFVAAVTRAAVDILLPFVVLAFIYSGFLFVRAQGNETELEHAKSAIKWSVVGAFILLGAWGFAQIIGQTVSTITN